MHDRTQWTRGVSGPQTIKGKSYKNLIEFKRPCVTCSQSFSIFVTSKIAGGHADSNSFGLKNCEQHRRNKSIADGGETDVLRTANVTMREELTGLYVRNKQLFDEAQVLKGRLAVYELSGAMLDICRGDLGHTSNSVLLPKMPWE